VLQWLEVLSIVGDLQCAVYSLHDLTVWLAGVSVSLFLTSISMLIEREYTD
jgi:hypothetical protein